MVKTRLIEKKNTIKEDEIKKDSYPNSVVVKVQLKIPEDLLKEIDFLLDISNISKEEFLTDLLINRLENLYNNPEEELLYYIKRSSLRENLRKGINQYYSKEIHKKCHKNEPHLNSDYEYELVEMNLKLPIELYSFFEKFYEITRWKMEKLVNRFIRISLELIYNSPEMIIEILKHGSLLESIKEGIDRINKKLEDNIQSG
ncbi:MAG: hypothetical protein BAJALOKI2v1_340046 [Promethearchaeota archaeon]|nr:MAG: hypothetical protein BAJALOKI2v1_340046 [Candidatus Lokiarchaeota archaeon]